MEVKASAHLPYLIFSGHKVTKKKANGKIIQAISCVGTPCEAGKEAKRPIRGLSGADATMHFTGRNHIPHGKIENITWVKSNYHVL